MRGARRVRPALPGPPAHGIREPQPREAIDRALHLRRGHLGSACQRARLPQVPAEMVGQGRSHPRRNRDPLTRTSRLMRGPVRRGAHRQGEAEGQPAPGVAVARDPSAVGRHGRAAPVGGGRPPRCGRGRWCPGLRRRSPGARSPRRVAAGWRRTGAWSRRPGAGGVPTQVGQVENAPGGPKHAHDVGPLPLGDLAAPSVPPARRAAGARGERARFRGRCRSGPVSPRHSSARSPPYRRRVDAGAERARSGAGEAGRPKPGPSGGLPGFPRARLLALRRRIVQDRATLSHRQEP